jgi:amino acid transporter
MSVEQFGYKQELKRGLSLWDLIIYGLIFMVPISPFAVFGYTLAESKGMIVLTFIIGAIAMLFTVLSYSSMSEAFPIAGSVYSYAQRGISQTLGFIAGWAMLLDYLLVPGLVYLVSASALTSWIKVPVIGVLIVFLIINTLANIRGIEFTAKVNKIIVIFLLIVLAIFLVFGISALVNGLNDTSFSITPLYDSSQFNLTMVMGSVSLAVLAFIGFDGVTTFAEEVRGGKKTVGKALMACLIIISSLFIIQTWIAADLAKGMKFNSLDTAFYEIAGLVGGLWLTVLCSLAIVISWGISAAIAYQGAISRLAYSMARDGEAPSALGKIHSKYQTPYVGIFIAAVISLIIGIIFKNHIDLLSNLVAFGALMGFFLLHVAVINHFFIRGKSKQYFRHLISPLMGLFIIGYVMYGMDSIAQIVGFSWLAIGILFKLIKNRFEKKTLSKVEGLENQTR